MHVLFLNRCFGPDSEATGQLLAELSTDLARVHRVTVIAGPPAKGEAVDGVDGVRVVRTLGTHLAKKHLGGRLANLATYFVLAGVAATRQPRPDVVVAETDPPLLGLLGAALKARWRCAFVYYCQDIYPDIALVTGGLRNPALLRLLACANDAAYNRADAIVVLGQDMQRRLSAKGIHPEKIVTIPNWADCAVIRPPPKNHFRQQFGDRFVVMYSGNFGLAQELETVIETADRLRGEAHILFVLIGDGVRRTIIERAARERRLANVLLLPPQPKEALGESLSAADLHLVPLRRGAAGCVVPSKVYGILAAARPFIALTEEHSEVARIAREFQVGVVTPPGDASALAGAIQSCRAGKVDLTAMGSRARRVAEEHFDRPLAAARFLELLRKLDPGTRAGNGGRERAS